MFGFRWLLCTQGEKQDQDNGGAIQSQVEDLVAEEFLKGTIARGQHVVLDAADGKLTLTQAEKTA